MKCPLYTKVKREAMLVTAAGRTRVGVGETHSTAGDGWDAFKRGGGWDTLVWGWVRHSSVVDLWEARGLSVDCPCTNEKRRGRARNQWKNFSCGVYELVEIAHTYTMWSLSYCITIRSHLCTHTIFYMHTHPHPSHTPEEVGACVIRLGFGTWAILLLLMKALNDWYG